MIRSYYSVADKNVVERLFRDIDRSIIENFIRSHSQYGIRDIEIIHLIAKLNKYKLAKSYVDSEKYLGLGNSPLEILNSCNNEANFYEEWLTHLKNEKNPFVESHLIKKYGKTKSNLEFVKIFIQRHAVMRKDREYKGIIDVLCQELVLSTKDPDFISYVTSHHGELGISNYKLSRGQPNVLAVKKIADIDDKFVFNSPNIQLIKIGQYCYTKSEYALIKQRIYEITRGIPVPIKGDPNTEYYTFCRIYEVIARNMTYDYEWLDFKKGDERPNDMSLIHGLYGGLVTGKCVCDGFAVILKNILSLYGIESELVYGSGRKNFIGHAWNIVKIGGAWYNTDLTSDSEEIIKSYVMDPRQLKFFLCSDKEFYEYNQEFRIIVKDKKCEYSIWEGFKYEEQESDLSTKEKARLTANLAFSIFDNLQWEKKYLKKEGKIKKHPDEDEFDR